jgi:hypothetical protein
MATTPATQGNVADAPKQTNQPPEERYKFTTPEQIRQYDDLFAKDKTFIRVDKDGKPLESDKNFFWRIVSMHPTVPEGVLGTQKFFTTFGLSKFDRTKFTETHTSGGRKERKYLPVSAFATNADGEVIDSDPWAAPHLKADDFFKQFKAED